MEPLHLKNNAWQYFFKAVLTEAIKNSPFARVITALQTEVRPGALQTRPNSGSMKHKGLDLICIIDLQAKILAVFAITL